MPSSEQVLKSLQEVANTWGWLAVVWHIYLAVVVAGLLAGRRPSARVAGALLSLPLISVSVLAWNAGNAFNGLVFALVAIATITISFGLGKDKIKIAGPWQWIPGIVMILFGWIYPHFLEAKSFLAYLYSAPAGLVPCPTLSLIVGFGLVLGGLGSRAWLWVVGLTGLFYGVFGAVRLGVGIDWILTAGALWLVATGIIMRERKKAAIAPHIGY